MKYHIPVLLNECIEYLITDPDGAYFEGTMGFGGHTQEILKKLSPDALYIGTDKDKFAFEHCLEKFNNDSRIILFNTSFSNIKTVSKIEFVEKFDGIFVDLGVSSYQLDNEDSGFTYRTDAILDLRMDKSQNLSARNVVNEFDEKEIADIIYQYGEEKKSRQIARRICEYRLKEKIVKTGQLKEIIEKVVGGRNLNKSLSRVFQALRIYVNDELGDLKKLLAESVELLKPGGRIAVISFHSLEDRIVKEFFKYESLSCICPPEFPVCQCEKEKRLNILTRKPVVPSDEELKENPRARSSKLRVAERI